MKTIFTLAISFFFLLSSFQLLDNVPNSSRSEASSDLVGAWQLSAINGESVKDKEVVWIISEGHFAITTYQLDAKNFMETKGGTIEIKEGRFTQNFEFHTADAENIVGTSQTISFELKKKKLTLTHGDKTSVWKRIDAGVNDSKNTLAGAWRIRERKRNGEMSTMKQGPRKTIKILSASRFQWTAFNSETKQFMGCGGGTYSAKDGIYTENIEFFSRDNNRVGASLPFNFERKGDDWHHSGKSSKGKHIYEIWALQD